MNISVNALTIDPEIHILQHSSYLRFVLGKGTAPFDTSIINHGLSYNSDFEHMTRNYTILCFDTNKRSLQIRLILRICRERLLNLLFHHPIIFLFGSSSIMNKGYKGKLEFSCAQQTGIGFIEVFANTPYLQGVHHTHISGDHNDP